MRPTPLSTRRLQLRAYAPADRPAAERLHAEDVVERGNDERSGHEPGDVRVEHDHHRPRHVQLVGEDEPLHYFTSTSRPT